MFDIGWPEMMVVAVIALIVIGPKDLPRVLRTVGHWTRKARMLAREFQSGVDDMVREAELQDAKKALDSAKSMNIGKAIEDTVDPTGAMKEEAKELSEAARAELEADPKEESGEIASDAQADGTADKAGGDEAEGATVIEQPVSIAPPHSLTPPEDEAPAKTTEKTA